MCKKTIVCAMALFAMSSIPSFADPVSNAHCGEGQVAEEEVSVTAEDEGTQTKTAFDFREPRVRN